MLMLHPYHLRERSITPNKNRPATAEHLQHIMCRSTLPLQGHHLCPPLPRTLHHTLGTLSHHRQTFPLLAHHRRHLSRTEESISFTFTVSLHRLPTVCPVLHWTLMWQQKCPVGNLPCRRSPILHLSRTHLHRPPSWSIQSG